jgi:hypothetical protein
MSPPDSILAAELRAARPEASAELRARVVEIAAREPATPRPLLPRRRLRRAALLLAPAAALAAVGVAAIVGATSSSRPEHATTLRAAADAAAEAPAPAATAGGALAPQKGRAQDYEALLRLRVGDLSAQTKRALRLTRGFGGYVRSVDYGSGSEAGSAQLVVAIPVGSVQASIVRFTALGSIVEQHVSIRDVQRELDARFRLLRSLREQIGTLRRRLGTANLPAAERRLLEEALARARARLVAVRREQAEAQRGAAFATVSLSLTSRDAAAAPSRPGRLERALDDARSILLRELVVLVYVAVVAGPLALLALLLSAGSRVHRRRSNERLLASR